MKTKLTVATSWENINIQINRTTTGKINSNLTPKDK